MVRMLQVIDYKDIYSQDLIKIKKVNQILMTKFYKFTKLKAMVHGKSQQTKSIAAESEDKVDDDNNPFCYDDIVKTCLNLSWNNTHTHTNKPRRSILLYNNKE